MTDADEKNTGRFNWSLVPKPWQNVFRGVVAFLVGYLALSLFLWGLELAYSKEVEIGLAVAVAVATFVVFGQRVLHFDNSPQNRESIRGFVGDALSWAAEFRPGVAEYILLLVVVVALIMIFRPQIEDVVNGGEWILAPQGMSNE